MKLGQLQEEISKASLPVSADLCKNIYSLLISNATYHLMNLDADITYQKVNLFSSDKCFEKQPPEVFYVKRCS